MSEFLLLSLVNGISVFIGLYVLWSLVKFGSLRQRAAYAAIAAAVSAVAGFLISGIAAGAI